MVYTKLSCAYTQNYDTPGLTIPLMIKYSEYRVKVTTHQFMLLLHLVDLFCVFLVDLFKLGYHTLTALTQGLLVIDQLRTRDRGVSNQELHSFTTFWGRGSVVIECLKIFNY